MRMPRKCDIDCRRLIAMKSTCHCRLRRVRPHVVDMKGTVPIMSGVMMSNRYTTYDIMIFISVKLAPRVPFFIAGEFLDDGIR